MFGWESVYSAYFYLKCFTFDKSSEASGSDNIVWNPPRCNFFLTENEFWGSNVSLFLLVCLVDNKYF